MKTAPNSSDIFCGGCKGSNHMVFIVQVYTPLEYDRSLYIFACNKRSCSLLSEGWVVVRNQTTSNNNISLPIATVSASSPHSGSTTDSTVVKANESIWNFLSDSSVIEPEIDLEELLAQRDDALAKKKGTPVAVTQESNSKPDSSLSCYFIEEMEDSWQGKNSSTVYDGSHINELLRSYLGEEDDEKVKEMVRTATSTTTATAAKGTFGIAMEGGEKKEAGDGDGDERDEDEDIDNEEDDEDEEEEEEEDCEEGGGDSNNGNNRKSMTCNQISRKVELYFQQRVQPQPRQVLRYAFEGQPLWITHPNPLGSDPFFGQPSKPAKSGSSSNSRHSDSHKGTPSTMGGAAKCVPCCDSCGARRVFELQLMPALLPLLHLPRAAPLPSLSSPASSNTATTLEQLLGDGVDFGVVAVFSCPNSCCSPAGRIAYEVAVVQPPPDLL